MGEKMVLAVYSSDGSITMPTSAQQDITLELQSIKNYQQTEASQIIPLLKRNKIRSWCLYNALYNAWNNHRLSHYNFYCL